MIQDALGVVADEIARPALLTQSQLAEQLQIHERTVFALRREGMPVVMIGDSPRYELAPCLAWLRARKAGAQ
jgi:phage terminase Nu1 subunit (DNA packaging protein)